MADRTVLLVEDDTELAATLSTAMSELGFTVWHAEDGSAARSMMEEARPDLVILDLMLPDTDGLLLCSQLRSMAEVPILICSGTTRKRDGILGLKLGADDFITKPFDIAELEARVEVVMRRHAAGVSMPSPESELRVGGLVVDPARTTVTLNGAPLHLTRTEFLILQALALRPDEVRSRAEISNALWGRPEPPGSRSIDMHVGRLRAKLDAGPGPAPTVESVRGFGYKISAAALLESAALAS